MNTASDLDMIGFQCNMGHERYAFDFFSGLPNDVRLEIFTSLNPATVLKSRAVCREWSQMLTQDFIWKNQVGRHYGIEKLGEKEMSWYSFYRSLTERFCSWDLESHHPCIEVDPTGRVASCDPASKNDTHLPIRGSQGVKEGRYYFEVVVQTRMNGNSWATILCAIGVADKNFITTRKVGGGYTRENNGIGYYSSGFQFQFGTEVDYGKRVTFKTGQQVGFLLDMNQKQITFFRERTKVGRTLSVLSSDETNGDLELFPVILSERGAVILCQPCSSIPTEILKQVDLSGNMSAQ